MLGNMNRQLRRAQEKLDQKAEREREQRKNARKARVQQLKNERKQRRDAAVRKTRNQQEGRTNKAAERPVGPPTKEQLKKLPGRFSGVLMIASLFFIVINSAVPVPEQTVLTSVTGAGFYLLYGYFSVLFLSRRGIPNGFKLTTITGLLLVGGMIAGRFFIDDLAHDWLMMGLAAPAVVLGAYFGRLVFDAGSAHL